jgi:hypothetical protein
MTTLAWSPKKVSPLLRLHDDLKIILFLAPKGIRERLGGTGVVEPGNQRDAPKSCILRKGVG